MPKIIECLESRLIEEARRQAEQGGYSSVTIRSVAESCGVGVGTVYNYFPSKDMLIASFLLQDWNACIESVRSVSEQAENCDAVLQELWKQLRAYLEKHKGIFSDARAAAGFGSAVGKYHGLLRSQLVPPLRPFCPDDFTAEFIAESMLTWTVSGKTCGELLPLIHKLL